MDPRSMVRPYRRKGSSHGRRSRRAVDEGAAAVVVSNHGGRQLDSVPPTLRSLPEVVAAVNGQTEVLMDGGIRRGVVAAISSKQSAWERVQSSLAEAMPTDLPRQDDRALPKRSRSCDVVLSELFGCSAVLPWRN